MPRNIDRIKGWKELLSLLYDGTGITVQVCDGSGHVLSSSPGVPRLCTAMLTSAEGEAACQGEKRRRQANFSYLKKPTLMRCPAGLSYVMTPLGSWGSEELYMLVGKVVTEVSGQEQWSTVAQSFAVEPICMWNAMGEMKLISGHNLERTAKLLAGLIRYLAAEQDLRIKRKRTISRQEKVILFLAEAVAYTERNGGHTELLTKLMSVFGMTTAALTFPGRSGAERSIALGPGAVELRQAAADRQADIGDSAGEGMTVISEAALLHDMGLEGHSGPLVHLASGADKSDALALDVLGWNPDPQDADLLPVCFKVMAALSVKKEAPTAAIWHQLRWEAVRQFNEAKDIENLLAASLDIAMAAFEAGRGSIFLAKGEDARVVAAHLRGDHADLKKNITRLEPDTVAHKVFSTNVPLLVMDTSRELARRRRRFPYRTSSFVSVPIRSNGEAMGVLHLTERATRPFNGDDLDVLAHLGLETGIALKKHFLEREVEELRHLSLTDPLTKLSNRRHLEECLNREFHRATRFQHPFALLMIDVDNLRQYNNRRGHEHGDRILSGLAQVLHSSVRSVDMVARYGGDEFVALLPETDLKGAIGIAEKIRAKVEATRLADEDIHELGKITVSIGLAAFPDMGLVAKEITGKADEALLRAKTVGRNIVMAWSGKP